MRHFTIVYFILISFVSLGQYDSIGVFIPKDDGSPFSWPTKHMWVGINNPIVSTYIGSEDFIKVWTDNGVVDSGDFYITNYCIRPYMTGNVNVFSIQRIWTGGKYDTIRTKSTFYAIRPPNISLKVTKDNFKKDSTITFALVDSLTLKPVNRRFKIGRMFYPLVYDSLDNFIGKLILCFGTTIDFAKEMHRELKVRSGYKLKIRLLVRDLKTDLLISTNELIYIIK